MVWRPAPAPEEARGPLVFGAAGRGRGAGINRPAWLAWNVAVSEAQVAASPAPAEQPEQAVGVPERGTRLYAINLYNSHHI